MKYCSQCKKSYPDKCTFCSNCGKSLQYLTTISSTKKETDNLFYKFIDKALGFFSWLIGVLFSLIKKVVEPYPDDKGYDLYCNHLQKMIKWYWYAIGITFIVFMSAYFTRINDFFTLYYIVLGLAILISFLKIFVAAVASCSKQTIDFIVKLAANLVVSMILMMLCMLIPPFGIAMLIIVIYKNKKRREFLDRYKRYLRFYWKTAAILMATIIISTIFESIANGLMFLLNNASTNELEKLTINFINFLGFSIVMLNALSLTAIFIGAIFMFKSNIKFYRKEQEKGIPFSDCTKLIAIVPCVWFLFFISILSLTHSETFSGNSLLADFDASVDMDTDFTSMNNEPDSMSQYNEIAIQQSDIIDVSSTSGVSSKQDTAIPSLTFSPDNGTSAGEAQGIFAAPDFVAAATLPNGISIDSAGLPACAINDMNAYNAFTPQHHAIFDGAGIQQGSMIQTAPNQVTFTDNMQQHAGTTHMDTNTGDTTLFGSDSTMNGHITSDGTLIDQNGIVQGKIEKIDNDTSIIKDSSGMPKYMVKYGAIMDTAGNYIGRIV